MDPSDLEEIARPTPGLSPTLFKTYQLCDDHGMSIRETAHLLGVSSGARARNKLKELVRESLRPGSPNQQGSSLHRISWQGGDNAIRTNGRSVAAVTRLKCDPVASKRHHFDAKTSIPHVHLTLGDTIDRPACSVRHFANKRTRASSLALHVH